MKKKKILLFLRGEGTAVRGLIRPALICSCASRKPVQGFPRPFKPIKGYPRLLKGFWKKNYLLLRSTAAGNSSHIRPYRNQRRRQVTTFNLQLSTCNPFRPIPTYCNLFTAPLPPPPCNRTILSILSKTLCHATRGLCLCGKNNPNQPFKLF
jgi:hypothetical protein